MISKTKISTDGFEKFKITSEMAEIFELPMKAVGIWVIVQRNDFYYRLRKVRLDGDFASDKYNNHQKISCKVWAQMFGGERCAKFEFSNIEFCNLLKMNKMQNKEKQKMDKIYQGLGNARSIR